MLRETLPQQRRRDAAAGKVVRASRGLVDLRRLRPLSAADEAVAEVVVHRRSRDPRFPGQCRGVHPLGRETVRRVRRLACDHADRAAPARLVEARLAPVPELPRRTVARLTSNAACRSLWGTPCLANPAIRSGMAGRSPSSWQSKGSMFER